VFCQKLGDSVDETFESHVVAFENGVLSRFETAMVRLEMI